MPDTPIKITFERIHEAARLPTKAHAEDAAFDLYAIHGGLIGPGHPPAAFHMGLKSMIPPGWCCLAVARSGLAVRGVFVVGHLFSPLFPEIRGGLFDSCYRGEWVILLDSTGDTIQFRPGDRIAQFLVLPVPDVVILEGPVTVEPDNLRGVGGLGSTGI